MSAAEEIAGYRVHPIASMFPLIEGRAFDDLVEDIREHGLREPVVVDDDGVLLDGRNRVRACEAAGVEITEDVHGGSDVAGFIVSHNLHRRHLTDAQRALIAARMANLQRGDFNQGGRVGTPIGGPDPEPAVTRSTAKDLMQVSEGSLHRAKVITDKAIPEVADMAGQGQVSLDAGMRVAQLPPHEQERFVADVAAGRSVREAAPKQERREPKPKPAGDSRLSRPQPPKYGGNRKKHAAVIDSIAVSLSGLAMAADDITDLDASVTSEEAARLADDLSKSIRSLNRIKQNLHRKATS